MKDTIIRKEKELKKLSAIDYNEGKEIIIAIDNVEEINKSIKETEAIIKKILLDIKEYETRLDLSVYDDKKQIIEEKLSTLLEKKEEMLSTRRALNTALEVLVECGTEFQRDFVPELNDKISKYIKIITNGKYSEVKVDDELMLMVKEPETGEVVSINELSAGTIDQIYLALRISASGILLKEPLPLFLDEVLSQYDDTRTENTFKMLKEYSKERQLFIFTCKTRELEIAKKIFEEELNVVLL